MTGVLGSWFSEATREDAPETDRAVETRTERIRSKTLEGVWLCAAGVLLPLRVMVFLRPKEEALETWEPADIGGDVKLKAVREKSFKMSDEKSSLAKEISRGRKLESSILVSDWPGVPPGAKFL